MTEFSFYQLVLWRRSVHLSKHNLGVLSGSCRFRSVHISIGNLVPKAKIQSVLSRSQSDMMVGIIPYLGPMLFLASDTLASPTPLPDNTYGVTTMGERPRPTRKWHRASQEPIMRPHPVRKR